MYLQSSNSLHSISASVWCKKNEAILAQIPCFGEALVVISIRVEPCGMVQPITHYLVEWEQDGSANTRGLQGVMVKVFTS